jgi:hypothetical protein
VGMIVGRGEAVGGVTDVATEEVTDATVDEASGVGLIMTGVEAYSGSVDESATDVAEVVASGVALNVVAIDMVDVAGEAIGDGIARAEVVDTGTTAVDVARGEVEVEVDLTEEVVEAVDRTAVAAMDVVLTEASVVFTEADVFFAEVDANLVDVVFTEAVG